MFRSKMQKEKTELKALIYKDNGDWTYKKTRIRNRKDGKEKQEEREEAWKRLQEIWLNPIQIISILWCKNQKCTKTIKRNLKNF